MRRALFTVGSVSLIVILGAAALSSGAFCQTGITVMPENPGELDSLEVTVNAVTTSSGNWIDSTSVEVTEGLIRIFADVGCGPFYMIDPYTFTVMVPPVAAGTYEIQYWATEECHLMPNPILTSEIVVSPEPIATEKTTWGAIKAPRE